jgi:hypothetical protein
VSEPYKRHPIVRHYSKVQGIWEQASIHGIVAVLFPEQSKVTLERPNTPAKFHSGLGPQIMMQMLQPALAHHLAHQRCPCLGQRWSQRSTQSR